MTDSPCRCSRATAHHGASDGQRLYHPQFREETCTWRFCWDVSQKGEDLPAIVLFLNRFCTYFVQMCARHVELFLWHLGNCSNEGRNLELANTLHWLAMCLFLLLQGHQVHFVAAGRCDERRRGGGGGAESLARPRKSGFRSAEVPA